MYEGKSKVPTNGIESFTFRRRETKEHEGVVESCAILNKAYKPNEDYDTSNLRLRD